VLAEWQVRGQTQDPLEEGKAVRTLMVGNAVADHEEARLAVGCGAPGVVVGMVPEDQVGTGRQEGASWHPWGASAVL